MTMAMNWKRCARTAAALEGASLGERGERSWRSRVSYPAEDADRRDHEVAA
jgi:hypothetical protein